MKEVLLSIADRIDKIVVDYRQDLPNTQSKDAMVGLGTDIAAIIREEAEYLDTDESKVVSIVEKTLNSLTGKK